MWSIVANETYDVGSALKSRLQYCIKPLPAIDFIVIVAYWSYEVLRESGAESSGTSKIFGSLRGLRMLRLLQMFELGEARRIKRAFKIVGRVMKSKGDDLFAALFLMIIAVIFVATGMYLVEGTSHDHDPLESFSSIPVSMYWVRNKIIL